MENFPHIPEMDITKAEVKKFLGLVLLMRQVREQNTTGLQILQ
jgi:hypothetical protein